MYLFSNTYNVLSTAMLRLDESGTKFAHDIAKREKQKLKP
jgi:hypothetical protein